MEQIDGVKVEFMNLIDDQEEGSDEYHRVRSDIRNALFGAVAGVINGPDDDVWVSEKGAEIARLIQDARNAPEVKRVGIEAALGNENSFIYLLTSLFEGLWEKKAWKKAIEWADANPQGISQAIKVDLRLQAEEAPAPDPEEMEGVETLYEDEEALERAIVDPENIMPPAQEVIPASEDEDMVDEPAKGGARRRTTMRSHKKSKKASKKASKKSKKSKKASKKTRRR